MILKTREKFLLGSVINFDYNKQDDKRVLNEILTFKLPKSGYLNKDTKGKLLKDITLDQLEYIANSCKQCSKTMKVYAIANYFLRIREDLDKYHMTQEDFDKEVKDVFSEIYKEDTTQSKSKHVDDVSYPKDTKDDPMHDSTPLNDTKDSDKQNEEIKTETSVDSSNWWENP